MNLTGTGAQLWPLVTGNNDVPALTQGRPTSFFCNSVPDRAPTGPLAYYLPCFLLTIYASLTQPTSGGSEIPYDKLLGALIDSVEINNCWHGSPLSYTYVKGVHLPFLEWYQGGYRYAMRRKPPIPASDGEAPVIYPVQYTIALYPSVCRLGKLMSATMQLAKTFQTGQVKVKVAAATELTSLSAGATFSDMEARCSAVLVPRNQLILGTPVEPVLTEIVAGSNANQIQIKGFGTDTGLKGIEKKGGVVLLSELTSVNNQGGAFEVENVTEYSFPWFGQDQTQHIHGMVAMQALGNMVHDRPNTFPTIVAGGDAEFNNPPYTMDKSDEIIPAGGSTNDNIDLTKMLAWIMVQGGDDLSLSDVKTADADKSYFLDVAGGFGNGTHMILGLYARQWLETMRRDWVALVTRGDDPLAKYVYGAQASNTTLRQIAPLNKTYLSTDNLAYLPWGLFPNG